MQTATKPPLTEESRREIISAVRAVTTLQMKAVATANNIRTQNMYKWLADPSKQSLLSDSKQITILNMLGLLLDGTLSPEHLHVWKMESHDDLAPVMKALTYESGMQDVQISPAYASSDVGKSERKFIGVQISWTAEQSTFFSLRKLSKERVKQLSTDDGRIRKKLLIATFPSDIAQDPFVESLQAQLRELSKPKRKPSIGEDLNVSPLATETIWRVALRARLRDGSRATIPPATNFWPFHQDPTGETVAPEEDPVAVLEDLVPRFNELAHMNAEKNSSKLLARSDAYLLRRANRVLASHSVRGSNE